MALFNYATKEITLKVVYYGPGLSGKTTNLQYLHASVLNPASTGKLLSLSTESDRTLFFDFLPVELGKIRDFTVRFQLYTVPGQVRYNATRKVVLKGADAVVFVADSQRELREQNIESFENMRENLLANNLDPDDIPLVLQYNKRDLRNIASLEEMNEYLNPHRHEVVEAVAINGKGVDESFRLITRLMLKHISSKHRIEIQQPVQEKEAVGVTGGTAVVQPSAVHDAPPHEEEVYEEVMEVEPTHEEVKERDALEIPEEAVEPEERYSAAHAATTMPVPPQYSPPAPEVREVPVIPVETINAMTAETRLMRESLADLQKMGALIDALAHANGILNDMRNAVYVLSKEMNELKEIRKAQEETNSLLRSLVSRLEGMKSRRTWFRF